MVTVRHARAAPNLHIPESKKTVKVSIIDTTSDMSKFPRSEIELDCCCFGFLIEHPSTKHKYATMPFDLGVSKNWENSPALYVEGVKQGGCITNMEKDFATVLLENGHDQVSHRGIL